MEGTTVTKEQNKTIVAFVLGLIIGGLLVWIFTPSANEDMVQEESAEATATEQMEEVSMIASEGVLVVANQSAGNTVVFTTEAYPATGGWIVVREYVDGAAGNILGAARYNTEQKLYPTEVELLRATEAGSMYRLSFFSDDGDEVFDTGVDGEVSAGTATFVAQ